MSYDLSRESWGIIRSFLPPDWQTSARALGALRRAREVKDEEVLLQLLLMHTAGGLSLKQASARAEETGLARVSAVALFKRLRAAEPWLRHLTAEMVKEISNDVGTIGPAGRRWRIMDATDVLEPGPTGSAWRVHYSLRLPELTCDFFEVTDGRATESLDKLPIAAGDVVLADRGYGYRASIARVLEARADVVVRINAQTFPLINDDGRAFRALHLRRLRNGGCGDWKNWIRMERQDVFGTVVRCQEKAR